MAFVFWSLVEGDYEPVGEQLLRVAARRPGADADGFRAAIAEQIEQWFVSTAHDYSIARLLLRLLALGARHGLVFSRGLMLLARALVTVEETAVLVDSELTLAELARPLLPELRRTLLLDPQQVEEAWRRNRFDYLELALELPDLLPELAARLRTSASVTPPPALDQLRSSWLPLAGALAAGALAAGLGGATSRRNG